MADVILDPIDALLQSSIDAAIDPTAFAQAVVDAIAAQALDATGQNTSFYLDSGQTLLVTIPTAAVYAAAQTADATTLTAVKADLKNTRTVTFGASSVTGDLDVAILEAAAAGAQEAFDINAVDAQRNAILDTETILTISGTYHAATSPASAPVASTDIYVLAFKNGTARLCARVYKDGADITQAAVSTITYSVYLLDEQDADTRTAVTGHTGVSLTVANVVFDALQTDALLANYNFRHTVPISVAAAFAAVGTYLVEYTITPVTGEKIIVRFKVKVE